MAVETNWMQCVMPSNVTIGDVISNLTNSSMKIVLIVSNNYELLGTITDGDVRRGLLSGYELHSSLKFVINEKPIVVTSKVAITQIKTLMLAHKIQQIPIVQADGKLIGVHFWSDLDQASTRENLFIIMAGGEGTRLLPHTERTPKPMIEVNGRPILEHIILRAKRDGFQSFIFAVHHLSTVIENYFHDGAEFGVSISYIREAVPLGTAGSLTQISQNQSLPFIVTNGDILTKIDYSDLLDYHTQNKADLTLAVRTYSWQNPFGVVSLQGNEILQFDEKPVVSSVINSGVYAISPVILQSINSYEFLDMSTLLQRALRAKMKVIAYPMYEDWIDIGTPADLNIARGRLFE